MKTFLFSAACGSVVGWLSFTLVAAFMGMANMGTLCAGTFPALLWFIYWVAYGRHAA
jgi:hypothetical protein